MKPVKTASILWSTPIQWQLSLTPMRYGGMSTSQLKRLKELEAENARLKRMYADTSLECMALKDVIKKKL